MVHQAPTPAFTGGIFPLFVAAFLLGLGFYFSLFYEPSLGHIISLSIPALGGGGCFWVLLKKQQFYQHTKVLWCLAILCVAIVCFIAGLGYACFYSQRQHTPFYPEAFSGQRVWVQGEVVEVNLRHKNYGNIKLKNVTTYHSDTPRHWPAVVITAHNKRIQSTPIGAEVSLQAQLRPPEVATHPQAYDWRRRSFFEGTSAIGFLVGEFYQTPPEAISHNQKLRQKREDIATQLKAQSYELGGKEEAAAIGVALLTGLRGNISRNLREAYTKSGLAHLMAISGMHLGMLAGFVYWVARLLMVRLGPLPLQYDIRKPAAFIAFFAALAYALLAGATVPTVRALVFIAGAFLAIIFNKLHLGVRVLAFAALGLAGYDPFLVIGASYQLSFVASFALLLWAYQYKRERLFLGDLAPQQKRWVQGVRASLLVTLATTPLVAVHFGHVPFLGLVANVVAIPLFAFAVLPAGFLWLISPTVLKGVTTPLYLWATQALNGVAAFFASFSWGYFYVAPEKLWLVFALSWGAYGALLVGRKIMGGILLLGLLFFAPYFGHSASVRIATLLPEGGFALSEEGYISLHPELTPPYWLTRLAAPFQLNTQCTEGYCSYKPLGAEKAVLTIAMPWASFTAEDCAQSQWLLHIAPELAEHPCPQQNLQTHEGFKNNATIDVFLKENSLILKTYGVKLRIWNKTV